jgi:hypothetical protein
MTPSRMHPRPPAEDHVPTEVLAGIVDGALTPPRWATHARACRDCRARLAAAGIVVRARAAGVLEAVPARAHARAIALFGTLGPGRRRGLGERLAAFGRLILAGPVQAGPSLAFGVRGVEAVTRCELKGGGWRVEVEWTPTGGWYALRGRVAPLAGSAPLAGQPRLLLEFEDGRRRRTPLSPRGFFGPVHGAAARVRAMLETPQRTYRSGWVDGRVVERPPGDA